MYESEQSGQFQVAVEDPWGSMADVRERVLSRAQECRADEAQIRTELDQLGPAGLWRELVRTMLTGHGIVQSNVESLAETLARALDIGIDELSARIAQGTLTSDLLRTLSGMNTAQ